MMKEVQCIKDLAQPIRSLTERDEPSDSDLIAVLINSVRKLEDFKALTLMLKARGDDLTLAEVQEHFIARSEEI